jgi:hypothetical protein
VGTEDEDRGTMPPHCQAVLASATEAYQNHEWQRAAEGYAALLNDPDAQALHHRIANNYALCQHQLGDNALAAHYMEVAGAPAEEVEHYRALAAQHPDAPAASTHAQQLAQQGTAHFHAQEWQQAIDTWSQLFLDPGYPADAALDVHWKLAVCYAHLDGPDDWHTAVAHAQAAGYAERDLVAAVGPMRARDAHALYTHACDLYLSGQWQQAADAFGHLFITTGVPAGEEPAVHMNIALCYAHLGEWDTAFEHVRAVHGDEDGFYRAVIADGLTPPVHQ